jgi:hypothetical protein
MSDAWKKHDRSCPPCSHCGAELYEKFWGNGGWAKTDTATDRAHHDSDCVKRLKAERDRLREMIRLAVEHQDNHSAHYEAGCVEDTHWDELRAALK